MAVVSIFIDSICPFLLSISNYIIVIGKYF